MSEYACPNCGCKESNELGTLGLIYWVRCCACGSDFARAVTREEDEEERRREDYVDESDRDYV